MNVLPLTTEEKAATLATHLVTITSDDLTETTVNTAQTLTVTVAAGDFFEVIAHKLVTPFEDASDAAFNTTAYTIGDGGSANRFLTSTELNVNGTEIDFKAGALGEGYFYNSADTVDFAIGSMSGKALNNIDTGELHVFIRHVSFNTNPAID